MEVENSLLLDVEAHVTNFITEQVPKEYAYHDIQHTLNVVSSVAEIGKKFGLNEEEMEILTLSAWFHDTGYDKGSVDHEIRGGRYAREYLKRVDYPEEKIQTIEACIKATKIPQKPENLLQRILCDADLSHLGKKSYWDRCSRLRQEMTVTRNIIMTDKEWVDFEIDFITKHHYHTFVAREQYDERKEKHIWQLRKQRHRLNPDEPLMVEERALLGGKKARKKYKKRKSLKNNESTKLKEISLGRGVETMYRTTYRTHVNLSSIADNKANIMLSINAIIISITVSTLVPSFEDNPKLILPTLLLLSVCLCSIVLATLSTRPKITEGKFTREDIRQKKSNLLFFGNFYNMAIDDFHWGMMEMIKDNDFLYSSMTRDLYYLGIVLAKKYRYLNFCYGIFMYGLIASVIAFAFAFIKFGNLF